MQAHRADTRGQRSNAQVAAMAVFAECAIRLGRVFPCLHSLKDEMRTGKDRQPLQLDTVGYESDPRNVVNGADVGNALSREPCPFGLSFR